jgi:hypothetical protein
MATVRAQVLEMLERLGRKEVDSADRIVKARRLKVFQSKTPNQLYFVGLRGELLYGKTPNDAVTINPEGWLKHNATAFAAESNPHQRPRHTKTEVL